LKKQALLDRANTGEKLTMLTCYDATFAKLLEGEGIDILLVGDSLGMVIQGADSTLNVSMHHMTYHTKCVVAGAPNTFIISDMPIGSYELDQQAALENAKWLMKSGADMVKFEGGGQRVDTAAYLVKNGIPVCAHLGSTPQAVNQLGGSKILGKTEESSKQILQDAIARGEAGSAMIELTRLIKRN